MYTVNHYQICELDENWLSSEWCEFEKKKTLWHANLQYVCNIPAKYHMKILKDLGGVNFTHYALLPTSKYVQWSKIKKWLKVKNAVNLSKKLQISSSCTSTNMSVRYLQSIERLH